MLPTKIVVLTENSDLYILPVESLDENKNRLYMSRISSKFKMKYEENLTNSVTISENDNEYIIFYFTGSESKTFNINNFNLHQRKSLVMDYVDEVQKDTPLDSFALVASIDSLVLYLFFQYREPQEATNFNRFQLDHLYSETIMKPDIMNCIVYIEPNRLRIRRRNCTNDNQSMYRSFIHGFEAQIQMYLLNESHVWIFNKSLIYTYEETEVTVLSLIDFFDCKHSYSGQYLLALSTFTNRKSLQLYGFCCRF